MLLFLSTGVKSGGQRSSHRRHNFKQPRAAVVGKGRGINTQSSDFPSSAGLEIMWDVNSRLCLLRNEQVNVEEARTHPQEILDRLHFCRILPGAAVAFFHVAFTNNDFWVA